MAYFPCKLSGGKVKEGTLTVEVSGSNNNPYYGVDFSSPGIPNNYFSDTGKVTISLDDRVIGTVPFKINTQANLHPDNRNSCYVRTQTSGSGTVELGTGI